MSARTLLREFKGQRIEGKTLAMLEMRIGGLIRIAEAAERNRCFEAVRQAGLTAQGKILRVKVSP